MKGLRVIPTSLPAVKQWVIQRHYAHAMPAITSHAFALIQDDAINGVCLFGLPSRHLNNSYGLFGTELPTPCFELTRLVLGDGTPENALSWFVSRAIAMMPTPCALVSYADTNQGHHGYIYQATNWIYTGMTNNHAAFEDAGGNRIHQRTLSNRYGSAARDRLPDAITQVYQDGKHRYVYFCGSKTERRKMRDHLKFPILEYPKGDNSHYETVEVGRQGQLDL